MTRNLWTEEENNILRQANANKLTIAETVILLLCGRTAKAIVEQRRILGLSIPKKSYIRRTKEQKLAAQERGEQWCGTCRSDVNLDEFHKNQRECKKCQFESKQRRIAQNPEKWQAQKQQYRYNFKTNSSEKYKAKNARARKARKENNPISNIFWAAKKRGKEHNIPFTITQDDIKMVEYCPVLGLKLLYGGNKHEVTFQNANGASLDKVIPELGYVPGNVRIISFKANRIKNDGTAEEHRLVYEYMKAHLDRTVDNLEEI